GKVEVAVYMCNKNDVDHAPNCSSVVTDSQRQAIDDQLAHKTPYVQKVHEETQAEAFQHYEQAYGSTALGQTATEQDMEDNFRVKLSDPSKYQVVQDAVGNMQGVASVVDEQQLLQPLFTFIHIAEYSAGG